MCRTPSSGRVELDVELLFEVIRLELDGGMHACEGLARSHGRVEGPRGSVGDGPFEAGSVGYGIQLCLRDELCSCVPMQPLCVGREMWVVAPISVLAPRIVNRTSELLGELLRAVSPVAVHLLDVGVEWDMGSGAGRTARCDPLTRFCRLRATAGRCAGPSMPEVHRTSPPPKPTGVLNRGFKRVSGDDEGAGHCHERSVRVSRLAELVDVEFGDVERLVLVAKVSQVPADPLQAFAEVHRVA